jgi:hypothetical protein
MINIRKLDRRVCTMYNTLKHDTLLDKDKYLFWIPLKLLLQKDTMYRYLASTDKGNTGQYDVK